MLQHPFIYLEKSHNLWACSVLIQDLHRQLRVLNGTIGQSEYMGS